MTTQTTEEKKGRGCFFYGCVTAVVLFLVVVVGGYLGVRYAFRSFIAKYTDTAPVVLPKVEIATADLKALQDRFQNFQLAAKGGGDVPPLELSGRDINALIEHDAQFGPLKGKVFLDIEGSDIKGQISLPLDSFGWSALNGRYLNGKATFSVGVTNHTLDVRLKSLQAKGVQIPEASLSKLSASNLAADANKDPKVTAALETFESIQIKDGKLIVRVKPPGTAAPPAEPPKQQ